MIQFLMMVSSLAHLTHGNITTRVIGAIPTVIEQYPILAQLLVTWDTIQYVQHCAGSILTTHHVLTAAHCFRYDYSGIAKNFSHPTYWKVRVGSSYRSHGGTVIDLQQIIVHPQFKPFTYENDLAIAILAKQLTFSDAIRQGAVPPMNTEIKPDSPCMLVGWGATETRGEPSEQLMRVGMFTVDHDVCKSRYAGLGATITNSMICAGRLDTGGADGCHGDSGGPLIYQGLIVGLVSFGHECGHPYYPGVYTKVASHTEWIVNAVTSTTNDRS
ncbi:Trypsin, alkaline C [Eumeta japonica]|uniref:Trypsin, alkaline C n=1 Tax=Eumeta variegata TaxID=151549 RepID=A0A4C1VYV1_EUMVA|nr:Trypsin, alkaline C [Eumeta japonica]